MVKLAPLALLCASVMNAQQQLTIQLAPNGAPAAKAADVAGASAAMASKAGAADSAGPITAPVSGYVLDSAGSVRPILGFGRFAIVGEALPFGGNIAAIIPSPNQNYLAGIDSSGLASLWVSANDGLGQVAFPSDVSETSSITTSPLGFSVAVISRTRGIIQVFASLPASPTLAFSGTFSEMGGAPDSLAVSDDGSTLLYTIQDRKLEALYMLQKGHAPQFVEGGSYGAVAFAPNSLDGTVAETAGNRVYVLHYSNGQYAAGLLADASAHISHPVAVEFSRDGQQIVVANGGSKTIQSFRLDGSGGSTTGCDCVLGKLTRLTGNAVFQITSFDGSTAIIFDGDVEPAAAVTIGVVSSGAN